MKFVVFFTNASPRYHKTSTGLHLVLVYFLSYYLLIGKKIFVIILLFINWEKIFVILTLINWGKNLFIILLFINWEKKSLLSYYLLIGGKNLFIILLFINWEKNLCYPNIN